MASFCEDGSEQLCSVNCWEFPEHLNDYLILKYCSVELINLAKLIVSFSYVIAICL